MHKHSKSWFVYTFVDPCASCYCASCYSAAAAFADDFSSLLSYHALKYTSVNAQVTFENSGSSLNKVEEHTYISVE